MAAPAAPHFHPRRRQMHQGSGHPRLDVQKLSHPFENIKNEEPWKNSVGRDM